MSGLSLEPRSFPVCMSSPTCTDQQQALCLCLYDHLARQAEGNALATSHRLAVADSRAVVERAKPQLTDRGKTLTTTANDAHLALRRMRTFLHQGDIGVTVQARSTVESRHAVDGAFDRRRRALRREIAWFFILLAAVFDTIFFGTLFRMLTNADPSTPWGIFQTVVAYFPGAVLAGSMLIAGIWLGDAVERAKNQRSGLPDADRTPPPWWPLPVGFFLLVITAIGITAWARPRFVEWMAQEQGAIAQEIGLPEWVVIILLITLSVTAISAELLSRNSFADNQEEVEKMTQILRERYDGLVSETSRAVLRHEQSWLSLREDLVTVWSDIEDLWAGVAWHQAHEGQVVPVDHLTHTEHPFAQVIRHTPLPPPAFGPLFTAYETLVRFPPEGSRGEFESLCAEGDSQWAG